MDPEASADAWNSMRFAMISLQMTNDDLKRRIEAIERRDIVRWLKRTWLFDKLIWNPVIKYSVRMKWSYDGRNSRIFPLLNRKNPNESGIDACGMFSICGWGWLWGYAVSRSPNGTAYNLTIPKDKKRAFVPVRRIGRIAITYLKQTA